jgi:lysophospholipase L1-like esterase
MSSRPSGIVVEPGSLTGGGLSTLALLRPIPESSDLRLGVLAFGDSITNGGGELQWGVALQSWALWVARGLGVPFTSYAADGATVHDVVNEQLPAAEQRTRSPMASYDLGCLYIGVNDVRGFDWDAARFERDFRRALRFLHERCQRVLTLTTPLDLGRPRVGTNVGDLNAVIKRVAMEQRTLVLDLRDFGARNLIMADHVHPTAFGQIAIAEQALHVVAADGMQVVVRPSTLIRYDVSRWRRLRGEITYTYRHLKVSLRALALTTYFRFRPPRNSR